MKVVLYREKSLADRTYGTLLLDGEFECHTLEDPVRPTKIAGVTAIPAGVYKLVITQSPRFRKRLPLLLDVPGFAGIRIHSGNTAGDTEGCILPGRSRTEFGVTGSRPATAALIAKLERALAAGEGISFTIVAAHEEATQ